ncbi:MAG: CidA/LrgA family protein [Lachnospiraceae bacterium]|nr:CidA/LrgA family protein [Lachnospiraceae bacterium]
MKYVKQLMIILAVSFAAEAMEYLIPLPVTASVYGLLLMLAALTTHVIPLKKVEETADYLVNIMAVMFVPAAVGIMAAMEELKQMALPLIAAVLISTPLVMIVTGWTAQFILRRRKKE